MKYLNGRNVPVNPSMSSCSTLSGSPPGTGAGLWPPGRGVVDEFEVIERAARDLGVVAKVYVRLKPALSGFTKASNFMPSGPLSTDIVAIAYKGGTTRDAAIRISEQAVASDHVELDGFHEYHGRHHTSTPYFEAQMVAYAAEIAAVSVAIGGYQPSELSIGGESAMPPPVASTARIG